MAICTWKFFSPEKEGTYRCTGPKPLPALTESKRKDGWHHLPIVPVPYGQRHRRRRSTSATWPFCLHCRSSMLR
jgi:hypothetical protein